MDLLSAIDAAMSAGNGLLAISLITSNVDKVYTNLIAAEPLSGIYRARCL